MNSNQNNQYRIFPFVILNSSRKIADPINQVDVSTKVVTYPGLYIACYKTEEIQRSLI